LETNQDESVKAQEAKETEQEPGKAEKVEEPEETEEAQEETQKAAEEIIQEEAKPEEPVKEEAEEEEKIIKEEAEAEEILEEEAIEEEEKPELERKEEILEEDIVEERIYTIPLRRVWISPRKKRVPRAVRLVRAFIQRHMKPEALIMSNEVNEKLWSRGIQKPPRKIRVRAVRDREGTVTLYLAEGD
jgi:large subunit ribosomal protein L31e